MKQTLIVKGCSSLSNLKGTSKYQSFSQVFCKGHVKLYHLALHLAMLKGIISIKYQEDPLPFNDPRQLF